jgi:hypothetical protein
VTDNLDALAELVHEQRRAKNAERDRPFGLVEWEDRTEDQKDLDRRIASAVAARAVADAKLDADRMRAQLLVLAAHFPAFRRALEAAIELADARHAREYRAALEALGGGETQERSGEKGAS